MVKREAERASAQVEALRGLMQQVFRRFRVLGAEVTPCGKPLSVAHAHALMVLRSQGECSQQALGAALGIDKSNVARLCARMVEAGHATQRACTEDGRSRRVALTARGQALAAEVDAASLARFEALLDALPVGERPRVLAALGTLVEAMRALPQGSVEE